MQIQRIYKMHFGGLERITTSTDGEYYPDTAIGRMVAGVMFVAIGFLSVFTGPIGPLLVTRKVR
jgi:hypothetical protein